MDIETIVIMLGMILVIYFLYHMIYTYSEIKYVKSDVDGNVYLIRRGNNKSEKFLKDSANTLALINKNVIGLVDYLFKNFNNRDDKFYFIKKLKENYKQYIISEAAVDPRYTTYTIDKRDMHICLRTRDTNEKVYDINDVANIEQFYSESVLTKPNNENHSVETFVNSSQESLSLIPEIIDSKFILETDNSFSIKTISLLLHFLLVFHDVG